MLLLNLQSKNSNALLAATYHFERVAPHPDSHQVRHRRQDLSKLVHIQLAANVRCGIVGRARILPLRCIDRAPSLRGCAFRTVSSRVSPMTASETTFEASGGARRHDSAARPLFSSFLFSSLAFFGALTAIESVSVVATNRGDKVEDQNTRG